MDGPLWVRLPPLYYMHRVELTNSGLSGKEPGTERFRPSVLPIKLRRFTQCCLSCTISSLQWCRSGLDALLCFGVGLKWGARTNIVSSLWLKFKPEFSWLIVSPKLFHRAISLFGNSNRVSKMAVNLHAVWVPEHLGSIMNLHFAVSILRTAIHSLRLLQGTWVRDEIRKRCRSGYISIVCCSCGCVVCCTIIHFSVVDCIIVGCHVEECSIVI